MSHDEEQELAQMVRDMEQSDPRLAYYTQDMRSHWIEQERVDHINMLRGLFYTMLFTGIGATAAYGLWLILFD